MSSTERYRIPKCTSTLAPLKAPRSARTSSKACQAQSGTDLHYAKEFWLSRRTCLTPHTPISTINRFCTDHGFHIGELGGSMPAEQRWSLFSMLESHNWPEGYDGLMLALQRPQAARPRRQQPEITDFHTQTMRGARRAAFEDAEGLPDASVDQLIQVIRQQTEMTQRFQYLLGESRGITESREHASDTTMQLIREHTEKTSSLLQARRPSRPQPTF